MPKLISTVIRDDLTIITKKETADGEELQKVTYTVDILPLGAGALDAAKDILVDVFTATYKMINIPALIKAMKSKGKTKEELFADVTEKVTGDIVDMLMEHLPQVPEIFVNAVAACINLHPHTKLGETIDMVTTQEILRVVDPSILVGILGTSLSLVDKESLKANFLQVVGQAKKLKKILPTKGQKQQKK